MSKTFCVMPWINVSTDPDGTIKPCCISRDVIKKSDGTPYNLGHDKIEDFFNSPDFVNIREKMLKGEKVDGCSQCYQLEDYGLQSKRFFTNRSFPQHMNKTNTVVDPYTDIEYFDLRFGNLCNLKCRSCIPLNSSQLDKQVIENPKLKKFYRQSGFSINEWYETLTYEENVYSRLEKLSMLYITGGETTLVKKNFDLLHKLVNEGHSKNIALIINSNMTNDKSLFYDLISQFKRVLFFVSIDGVGKIQEYIRYPSNWEQISSNFTKVVERKTDNLTIKVAPVVQIMNLGNLPELFEYCESFNRKYNKLTVEIFLNILENPYYLSLVNLPLDYKIKCWERIEKWVNTRCKYQPQTFHLQLKTLKNKCFDEVDYKNKLDTFFEFNQLVDECQDVKMEEANPEVFALRNK